MTQQERTRSLVSNLPQIRDAKLRDMAVETGMFGVDGWKIGGPKAIGEEVLYTDMLMILGVERGLWDESGYLFESKQERRIDEVYSRSCVELAHQLWSEEKPLLVRLILKLKHSVRGIDDESLLEINRVLNSDWWQEDGGEVFEWRLETLRLALAAVLTDRKYRNV